MQSGQALNLTTLANDRIVGIEMIDLTGTGNNSLSFNASDVIALSDSDDLRVDGNVGDNANSTGQGWNFVGNVGIGVNLYEHYVIGTTDLYVDTDVAGTIS